MELREGENGEGEEEEENEEKMKHKSHAIEEDAMGTHPESSIV